MKGAIMPQKKSRLKMIDLCGNHIGSGTYITINYYLELI
jgi:hypothetical protein